MFEFPLDKLTLCNSALVQTGDNVCNAADNGSDEWLVCSAAYERGMAYAIESHNWGFDTVVSVLQPSNVAPSDTDWDTAYLLPNDLVHLIWVKINQNTSNPSANTNQLTVYDIMVVNGQTMLVVNARGGPPPPQTTVTPAQVTIKYISNQGALSDSTNGTPTLILALQTFIQSGIYRGLHEDVAEADKLWLAGEQMLQRARTRYDQQKPKRQFLNSRITASRRVRRPYPPQGIYNWGSGPGNSTPG